MGIWVPAGYQLLAVNIDTRSEAELRLVARQRARKADLSSGVYVSFPFVNVALLKHAANFKEFASVTHTYTNKIESTNRAHAAALTAFRQEVNAIASG